MGSASPMTQFVLIPEGDTTIVNCSLSRRRRDGGRGGRTRTCEWRSQSPMCYRFTTPLCRRRSGARPNTSKWLRMAVFHSQPFRSVGWVKGLEPSTPGTTIRCSNQLSYTHHIQNRDGQPARLSDVGTPEGTRTPGLLLRRQLLYPAELLAHIERGTEPQLERVKGIEPSYPAWKAGVLPLNYTRKPVDYNIISVHLSRVISFFEDTL